MGIGSDLMRFFASDSPTAQAPLKEFHKHYEAIHRYPALNLRAAERLSDAGYLYHGEPALGHRVLSARFRCTKSTADLQTDLAYGTFDFIVDGLAAVRSAFEQAVFHIVVTGSDGSASGSAFAVTNQVLLTARHCFERGASVDSIEVMHRGEAIKPEHCLLPKTHTDVAALFLAEPIDVATFRVRAPAMLEPVLTMGFPTLQGLYPSLMASAGELSGHATAYLDHNDYWVTTCAMTGGSSGGPVVGVDGAVVGLVSSFPASDAGIDPGRFGLMAACVEPLREIAENVAKGSGQDLITG